MNPRSEAAPGPSKPKDLLLTRTFDAPRRLVFEAWTKAEHVSRWFAPRPLTMARCEVDFRAGGGFRFVMLTPDGIEYPFEGSFREIAPPERIVFSGKIHDGNEVVTTITFADQGDETLLTVHQSYAFESDSSRGAQQGWTLTLDQLGKHLNT